MFSKGSHHTHGDEVVGLFEPPIETSRLGLRAILWSFSILVLTGMMQMGVVYYTGSVALLADTLHSFADAGTSLPLWIAFKMAQKKPTRSFNYGYGRMEDLAGVFIVGSLVMTAVSIGYHSIQRLYHVQEVQHLGVLMAASLIGFLGNEVVAIYRIRVGKKIHSAALVADGYHARMDGLTSLAVLFGAIGVWLGFPVADPLIGLVIIFFILKIAWNLGWVSFVRLVDGIDPQVIDTLKQEAASHGQVQLVSEVRARWSGHYLLCEINIAVDGELRVEQGHQIAKEVRQHLLTKIPHVAEAIIHIDPVHEAGEKFHKEFVSGVG